MIDRCTYELLMPCGAVEAKAFREQLALAHKRAGVLLRKRPYEGALHMYSGPNGDKLWLSTAEESLSRVQLMLADLDVETISAIAEILHVLGAQLVPRDDGPTIPAHGEAILHDVLRRALHRIRTPGFSLYEAALECEVDIELEEATNSSGRGCSSAATAHAMEVST